MSYDDWKCAPPEGDVDAAIDVCLGEELDAAARAEEAETFTCDCGAPIDPTTGVSMCRPCFDSCEVSRPTCHCGATEYAIITGDDGLPRTSCCGTH